MTDFESHNSLRDYIDTFDCAGMVNELPIKALRAVVELHKPMEENCECNREHVPICEECVDDYPCKTIETIEKELSNG